MAHALAKENKDFITRMIAKGRFNNQSEVIREALRRMERSEAAYLNPPPLSDEEIRQIYRRDSAEERLEAQTARSGHLAIKKLVRKGKLNLKEL